MNGFQLGLPVGPYCEKKIKKIKKCKNRMIKIRKYRGRGHEARTFVWSSVDRFTSRLRLGSVLQQVRGQWVPLYLLTVGTVVCCGLAVGAWDAGDVVCCGLAVGAWDAGDVVCCGLAGGSWSSSWLWWQG